MRDYVILHARQDADQASMLEQALGGRGAVSCALRANGPVGNFGPQFMLVALWSAAAEAEGLGPVMAKMFAGRARKPAIVLIDGARAPVALLAHTNITLPLRARDGSATEIAAQLFAQGNLSAPAVRKPRTDQRKALGFAATAATAMFSFAGSAALAGMTPAAGNLAWAASEDAHEPSVVTASAAAAEEPAPLPNLDPILARADAIMAQAQAVSSTPAVKARFQVVQRVAAADVDLRAVFEAPAPAVAAVMAPPATELAAATPTPEAAVEAAPSSAAPAATAEGAKALADSSLTFSGFDVAALN